MRVLRISAVVLFLFLLASCGHVLPKEALREVDPGVEFGEVKANPQAYEGETLLLGGQILDVQVEREGTVLEVLRYTLDRWGYPLDADEAGGRFLVTTDRILDPSLYQKGMFITLTGTVAGVESRPLGKADYRYPVFRLKTANVWKNYPYSYTYPYRGIYDPYFYRPPFYRYRYYPYGYDPFFDLYDPFWYPHYDPFWYGPRGRRIP